MADDRLDRKTLFVPGARYRVLESVVSGGFNSGFTAGEELRFGRTTYSHYDGCHVYEFKANDGSLREYWLGDEQPIGLIRTLFKRMGLFG